MIPNEPDWKKELSPPPLEGRGFDDKLRRKIEEQLDRKEYRRRKRLWFWPVLSSCCVLAIGTAIWTAILWQQEEDRELAVVTTGMSSNETLTAAAGSSNAAGEILALKTGVLIGLREDHNDSGSKSDGAASTYRTLMIAPVDGQIRVTAEGTGILVPYGQKFWKIDSVTRNTETGHIQYLSAYPADKPPEDYSLRDNPKEYVMRTEKLLFAGNQYVSVAEQEETSLGGAITVNNRVWVRKLNQMSGASSPSPSIANSANTSNSANANRAPDLGYVSVMDIFGGGALGVLRELNRSSDLRELSTPPVPIMDSSRPTAISSTSKSVPAGLSGDNWTITRKPGHWIAQVAEASNGINGQPGNYRLLDYPTALPEVVTAHDEVCCTGRQIKRLHPDAKDLISSPLEDIMVVFTKKEIAVHYSGSRPTNEPPLLRIPLKPGEKLVSAQWATGSYVSAWVEKTRKFLEH